MTTQAQVQTWIITGDEPKDLLIGRRPVKVAVPPDDVPVK
jgi:hypothetical protein